MTTRRGFLAAVLAAMAAPAVVKAGVLMPVRPPIWTPPQELDYARYGEVVMDRGAGAHIDIFTAAGVLLATIPMGDMQTQEFDFGFQKAMALEGGVGQVLTSGTAERFKLSNAGMWDMEGCIGPGGLSLDNPAIVTGQDVHLQQFAVRIDAPRPWRR